MSGLIITSSFTFAPAVLCCTAPVMPPREAQAASRAAVPARMNEVRMCGGDTHLTQVKRCSSSFPPPQLQSLAAVAGRAPLPRPAAHGKLGGGSAQQFVHRQTDVHTSRSRIVSRAAAAGVPVTQVLAVLRDIMPDVDAQRLTACVPPPTTAALPPDRPGKAMAAAPARVPADAVVDLALTLRRQAEEYARRSAALLRHAQRLAAEAERDAGAFA